MDRGSTTALTSTPAPDVVGTAAGRTYDQLGIGRDGRGGDTATMAAIPMAWIPDTDTGVFEEIMRVLALGHAAQTRSGQASHIVASPVLEPLVEFVLTLLPPDLGLFFGPGDEPADAHPHPDAHTHRCYTASGWRQQPVNLWGDTLPDGWVAGP